VEWCEYLLSERKYLEKKKTIKKRETQKEGDRGRWGELTEKTAVLDGRLGVLVSVRRRLGKRGRNLKRPPWARRARHNILELGGRARTRGRNVGAIEVAVKKKTRLHGGWCRNCRKTPREKGRRGKSIRRESWQGEKKMIC